MQYWLPCPREGCDGDVEVTVEYEPGEPRVRYYPDGSGYPGSPPYMRVVDGQGESSCGCVLSDDELMELEENEQDLLFDLYDDEYYDRLLHMKRDGDV